MYDIIIVGGGPAGLCASIYAARKKLDTLLITADIGGQINNTLGIANYLGYQFIEGPELISKFQTQVGQFPIAQKIGVKVAKITRAERGLAVISESGEKYEGRTVIFAAGKRPKKLGVPGEAELLGHGVTYCAICDGPVFAGQRVAIVGGGNSAVSATLDMVKIAEHVDLVSLTGFTADPILVEQLKGIQNLSVFTHNQTQSILGSSKVEGMVIKDLQSEKEETLNVTGIFVEIGLLPNSEPVKGLVQLNKWGEVPVSCAGETTLPELFAAGDVTDVPEKQIIIAAGEGAKAALQAHRYLQRGEAD